MVAPGLQVDVNVFSSYGIGVSVTAGPEAQRFVDFVMGEQGRQILHAYGFE
ncbi:MAG: substrate-binding domain-containing protein [Burkholderiales bacterium]